MPRTISNQKQHWAKALQSGTRSFWLVNAVSFQLAWWSIALWLATNPVAVTLWLALLLVGHFICSPSRKADLALWPIAVIGFASDLLWLQLGWLQVQGSASNWLALLWLHFTLTLNHSLNWLMQRPAWQAGSIGALAGMLSYLAALQFKVFSTPLELWVFSCCWTVLWLGLTLLFRHYWQWQQRRFRQSLPTHLHCK